MNHDHHEPAFEERNGLPPEAFDLPVPSPELRAAVLRRTSRILRRRVRRRRALALCAILGAYAAGLATAYLATGPASAPAVVAERAEPALPAVFPPEDRVGPAPRPALSDEVLRDSERLALLLAKAQPETRSRLLKEAGDRYLNDYGAITPAVGCYRQYVALLGVEDLDRIDMNETWLLQALKQARLEEG